MLAFPRLRLAAALALGLGAAVGCGAGEPDDFPAARAAAVRLFDMARSSDPEARPLPELFEPVPKGASAAALGNVLDELGRVADPRVVAVESIDGQERVAVDVAGTPAAGGSARYSVQLALRDGTWRVEWIGGPGLFWPERTIGGRGSGLSNSPNDGPP